MLVGADARELDSRGICPCAPRWLSQPRDSVALDCGVGAVCGLAKSSPTTPTPFARAQAPLEASQSAAIGSTTRGRTWSWSSGVALLPRPVYLSPPSLRTRPRWLHVSLQGAVPLACPSRSPRLASPTPSGPSGAPMLARLLPRSPLSTPLSTLLLHDSNASARRTSRRHSKRSIWRDI